MIREGNGAPCPDERGVGEVSDRCSGLEDANMFIRKRMVRKKVKDENKEILFLSAMTHDLF